MRRALLPLAGAAALLVAACHAGPSPQRPTAAATKAPPTAVATVLTSRSTPAPTVLATPPPPAPTPVGMAVVRVADGIVLSPPPSLHHLVWSPDSTRLAGIDDATGDVEVLTVPALGATAIGVTGATEVAWIDNDHLAIATTDRIVIAGPDGHTVATIYADSPSSLAAVAVSSAMGLLYATPDSVHVWSDESTWDTQTGPTVLVQPLDGGRLAVVEPATVPAVKYGARLLIYSPFRSDSVAADTTQPVAAIDLPADPHGIGVAARYEYAAYQDGREAAGLTSVIVDIASGRTIATFPDTQLEYALSPAAWDPEGMSVLLQQYVCTPKGRLAVANAGGRVTPLADGFAYSYAWSPNGSRVAFSRGRDLWTVPSDGSAPPTRLVADGVHGTVRPAWSPSGEWLLFQRFAGGFGACD